jgi:H+/Cl- antiporter ClcA
MMRFLEEMGMSFAWIEWVQSLIGGAPLPPMALWICIIFALIGTALLSNYTAKSVVTTAMNTAAMFIGALIGNLMLRGIHLPLDPERQAPVVFALAGMIPAALLMLAVNKPQ